MNATQSINSAFPKVPLTGVTEDLIQDNTRKKVAEVGAGTIDACSISCNSLIAASVTTPSGLAAIGTFCIIRGLLGMALGLNIFAEAAVDLYKGCSTRTNALKALFGLNYALISAVMFTGQVGSVAAVAATTLAMPIIMPIFYGSLALWAGYGMLVQHNFGNKVRELKDQSPHDALTWLKGQVKDEKSQAEFISLTSEATCRLVSKAIIEENPNIPFILNEVEKASSKQFMTYGILFAIGCIGLTASAVSFATGGAAVPALLVVSTFLFLFVDITYLNQKLGDKLFSRKENAPVMEKRTEVFSDTHAATGRYKEIIESPDLKKDWDFENESLQEFLLTHATTAVTQGASEEEKAKKKKLAIYGSDLGTLSDHLNRMEYEQDTLYIPFAVLTDQDAIPEELLNRYLGKTP